MSEQYTVTRTAAERRREPQRLEEPQRRQRVLFSARSAALRVYLRNEFSLRSCGKLQLCFLLRLLLIESELRFLSSARAFGCAMNLEHLAAFGKLPMLFLSDGHGV